MTNTPSGISVYSPKIRDEALVRKFVSLNGTGYVAVGIFNGVNPVDPDADTLTLTVRFNDVNATIPSTDPRGTVVLTATSSQIQKADVGKYSYNIGPQYTGNRGTLVAEWTYQVNGTTFTFLDYLQVLDQMPFYETLKDQEKSVVEQVSWMFADLYDSTEGGPHLIEEFQTHFDYERLAQLQRVAVTRFNTIGWPVTNYGVGPGTQTLMAKWSGIAVLGTYYEVIRHLVRSYTEIPMRPGVTVAYVDRSQYAQKWQTILSGEWEEYRSMVIMAKSELLQLGRSSILVSGGIYSGGGGKGIFQSGTYSAQVRSWRMYPAAPAISWGATHR